MLQPTHCRRHVVPPSRSERGMGHRPPPPRHYFRDFFRAHSGMLAALHVLAALAETDGTASELLAGHDPYPSSGEINSEVPDPAAALERVREHTEKLPDAVADELDGDRKSTRLNSSHVAISYAVF